MKNRFFYNTSDIQKMKELIRTGQPLLQIARNEHANFGASQQGFYLKLTQLAKSTTKIREWSGPKKLRRTKKQMMEARQRELVGVTSATSATPTTTGFVVPQGTSFEGTPKRVEIFADHFRIYF